MGIVVDARLNAALTAVLFVEIGAALVGLLRGHLARGCPLGPEAAAAALVVSCVVLFPLIQLVKRVSGALGALASRTLSPGDPLAKHRTRTKFADQCWQLFVHLLTSSIGAYVIWYDGAPEPWLREYWTFWMPHPSVATHKPSLHLLYLVQAAVWIVTALSHRFLEERHKDYVLMYTHHLVTIALVILSYEYGYLRIGAVVMLLHDFSDIFADLVKIANYLKWEGPRHLFLVELCFASVLVTWAYCRLYLYGYHVVWLGGWVGAREVGLAPGAPGVTPADVRAGRAPAGVTGHAPGFRWPGSVGDGTFDVVASVLAVPAHATLLPGYWTFCALMTVLLGMHWMWYALFWRILFRLLAAESANDVGRDEYEGDSDDD